MKFGIREVCDVVLRAKSLMSIGNKVFYPNEPVIYFDSLKTSTLEGAATTVYAQGGRGNSRLVAWEGERTVTFTMEDALISTEGLAILTGADLVRPQEGKFFYQHVVEPTNKITVKEDNVELELERVPSNNAPIYVMVRDEDRIISEPYIASADGNKVVIKSSDNYTANLEPFKTCKSALVDYYVAKGTNQIQQIEITPNSFGGNFYLEASTLFRDSNGVDMPAEFIIPNCKVQSNFTFNLNSSGDPSTFTFTMDAFPDYTRFDKSKKVLSVIQIISEKEENSKPPNRHPQTPGLKPSEGLAYSPVYKNGNTEGEVIGYEVSIGDCTDTDIIIPNEYDGMAVIGIGDSAFAGANINSITIPDSVTSINYSAFAHCYVLTSVTIPDSVTSIGDCAFSDCYDLTSVTFPDSVTSIGAEAFASCIRLTSVTILNSVTSIGNYAFYNCISLTSVSIGGNIEYIDEDAFGECDSLKRIDIARAPESIEGCPWGANDATIYWNGELDTEHGAGGI